MIDGDKKRTGPDKGPVLLLHVTSLCNVPQPPETEDPHRGDSHFDHLVNAQADIDEGRRPVQDKTQKSERDGYQPEKGYVGEKDEGSVPARPTLLSAQKKTITAPTITSI